MAQTFACPECGAEVHPARIGPARQTRCGRCGTLIEVPFFPRTRRRRGRRKNWLVLAGWAGLSLVTLVVVAVAALRLRNALDQPTRSRSQGSQPALSRADVEARIVAIEAQEPRDPQAAVERASRLLEQLDETAMADLVERVRGLRSEARIRWVETLLSDARAAEEAEPARAVSLCETAIRVAANLPPGRSRKPIEAARALATAVVERAGVVLTPAHGRFVLGSPEVYNATFHPPLADALRRRGYVPPAANSPFPQLWNEHAPFRMTIEVSEEPGDYYLQSRNRTSHVTATFVLSREGKPLWQITLNGRTQVPLPNLRAFEDSRLAISNQHNPAVEHRFHQNAVNQLLDRLGLKLRDLPAPGEAGGSRPH